MTQLATLLAASSLLLASAVQADSRMEAAAKAKALIEAERRIAEAPFESRFAIDDSNPERAVPSVAQRDADPLSFGHYIMNLSDKAEAAKSRNDHLAEARYYGALAKAVPENAVGLVKQCAAYESAGMRDEAQRACRDALDRTGVTLVDYAHYAALVLSQPTSLSASQIRDLDSVVAHLRSAAADSTLSTQIACDMAVRLSEVSRLTACVEGMRKQMPTDPEILPYEWALAVQDKNFASAAALVQRAKERGLPKAAEMERATNELTSPWRRTLRWLKARPPALGAVIVAAGMLALLATIMQRQRRKQERQQIG